MFGRLRPASSSLDSLELERSHSKLFKDDSLSIYEATLMKLKRGSQLATHPPIDDPVEIDCISSISSAPTTTSHDKSPTTVAAANCSSSPISSASSVCQSTVDLKHQPSVLDLFSKYRVSHQQSIISSQTDVTMATPDDDVDSGNDSQSSSIL